MRKITFQRNLISLEDLLIGIGTVEQTRGIDEVEVTKISGANLPYDDTYNMKEKFDLLQAEMDNLPPLVDDEGNFLTGLISTSTEDLSATHAGRIWQKEITATEAQIYYGTVMMYKYNPTTGDLITDTTAYIAADVVVTDAFIAADVVVTDAYIAADVVVTDAYIAADVVVTDAFTLACKYDTYDAKATPVSADSVAIIDSADSNINKKLTYANLLTALNADLSFTSFIKGRKRVSTNSVITVNDTVSFDDTIPQITEGTEILSTTYTIVDADNYLKILVDIPGCYLTGSFTYGICIAIFVGTGTDAIAAKTLSNFTGSLGQFSATLASEKIAGLSGSQTISVRMGVHHGGIIAYVNGKSTGERRLGGVQAATMIIEEVAP